MYVLEYLTFSRSSDFSNVFLSPFLTWKKEPIPFIVPTLKKVTRYERSLFPRKGTAFVFSFLFENYLENFQAKKNNSYSALEFKKLYHLNVIEVENLL